jgi:hypothetical protein
MELRCAQHLNVLKGIHLQFKHTSLSLLGTLIRICERYVWLLLALLLVCIFLSLHILTAADSLS